MKKRIVIMSGLVALVAGTIPFQSALAGDDPAQRLSTPQLLAQAVQKGEIDKDTRLLYLTYAIYEPESLPEEYRSNVGWHGTEYVRELKDAYFNRPETISSDVLYSMEAVLEPPKAFYEAAAEGASPSGQLCDRANEANFNNTSSSRFAFSYGAIGGELTVTDYITSMDNSANVILNSYKWAEPPLCTQDGTTGDCKSGADSNKNNLGDGNGRYPVLITNLGSGLYGYVDVNIDKGQGYNGFVGDNPNTSTITETDSRASCMVINSDFSSNNFNDSGTKEKQLNNLNGTTSHEYVHAVQFGWGDPGEQMDAMWAESTAAYFEDEVYDSANSAYIYLYGDFNQGGLGPDGWKETSSPDDDMYRNFLFFRYITEQCGGANKTDGGENIIQAFFENIAVGGDNTDKEVLSLKKAVEEKCPTNITTPGSLPFKDLFHNWAIAAKFMKDCQDNSGYDNKYCLEEGAEYKARSSAEYTENPPGPDTSVPKVAHTVNTVTSSAVTGSIKDTYGLQWIRLPLGSTSYKITLSRTSGAETLRGSVVCDKGTSFDIQPLGPVTSSPQSVTVQPNGCADVVLVMTNEHENFSAGAASGYSLQVNNTTNSIKTTLAPIIQLLLLKK